MKILFWYLLFLAIKLVISLRGAFNIESSLYYAVILIFEKKAGDSREN